MNETRVDIDGTHHVFVPPLETSMNHPRESLLTLFDPLFSGDAMTPPPCRDVPSPDLGSDKENAAPANDSSITLTKFFNRIYTRPKAHQQPLSLPKGRLIDFGDSNASYEHENDDPNSDSDGEGRNEHVFVVQHCEPLPASREEEQEVTHGSPQRRPLADIALGDSKCRSSPVPVKGASSSSPFGSPSSFRLARPTPAPSSSPLASVINAINGTPSSRLPPLTPSAPRIAVTPAEPSSPSPTRRQPRPGAMLHPSPDGEADSRRTSVDLQASLSVHFDESSFDLLKDKISLPEHDSMGDLDMDMGSLAIKAPERGDSGENVAMPSTDVESDGEPDFGGLLEERLRDMKITDDEVPQSKDGDGMDGISTPPALFNYNPSSKFFFSHARLQHPLGLFPFEAPQAPVRQCVRQGNKNVPALSITSNAPPALLRKRGARASISALPLPAATTALRTAKKAKPDTAPVVVTAPFLGRKTAGGVTSSSHATIRSAPPPPPPPRAMELGGVQRPPASSMRAQAQSHRNTQTVIQAQTKGTATVAVTASRSSGLRPPTSRASNSGIAVLRRVSAAGGGAMRTSMAVGGGAGRLGSSGVARTGLVKGDGASSAARLMRRA